MPARLFWIFRIIEIALLKESDVKFYEEHIEVLVESSKTDQFRERSWVLIARTYSDICPVSMLEGYFELATLQKMGFELHTTKV